jgi:hypothetical protein
MLKLKEVKAKSEDSGSKARQYLDGLLKIPFSIYKKEPILFLMDTIRSQFKDLYEKYEEKLVLPKITNKLKYTSLEILKYVYHIKNNYIKEFNNNLGCLKKKLNNANKKEIVSSIGILNQFLEKNTLKNYVIDNKLKKNKLKEELNKFIYFIEKTENNKHLSELNEF